MFDSLTEKLTAVFQRLSSRGRLTEGDVDEALREIRLALLEADVNFKVARDFVNRVRERTVGAEVLQALTPGQQVVKIVHQELTNVLGVGNQGLSHSPSTPNVAMLVGLQGSGKTTTCAKLALHLRRSGHKSLMVAADLRRPAAVEQLAILGKQLDIPVHQEGISSSTVAVARNGVVKAKELGAAWVILDTGGRLHIDDELMQELEEIKDAVKPAEVLLVADSMTGQDAVRAAEEFHRRVGLTGIILTKLDGDARGGAALSMSSVTGVPIKFVGVGEKVEALDPFYPERMASRILGMGDVLSLIEKAQVDMDEKKAKEMERKLRRAELNMDDFLEQLQQLKKMGSLSQVLEMIPGVSALSRRLPKEALDDRRMKRVEAIVLSMTREERRSPKIIDGSRKRRIARGSGTSPQEVNQLLNQFQQMQLMVKRMGQGRFKGRFPGSFQP